MYTQYGVREICDVVFKAKATMTVGNRKFYKGEPVIYFDTLKTSTLEGAATTVYATGGRGNSRLVAWEGERTVTFTMEDALISPVGFMLLSGAGLIQAGENEKVYQHVTETVEADKDKDGNPDLTITLSQQPAVHEGSLVYVLPLKKGKITSEPYIVNPEDVTSKVLTIADAGYTAIDGHEVAEYKANSKDSIEADAYLVDYYVEHTSGAMQIEITPDSFGGNFYIEASTLFRDTNGSDYPAEFIIPNAKIQSNFNFSMASSGDPSTFTFTCDAFPDYTRFNKTKKVIAALQIITGDGDNQDDYRTATVHSA